MIVMIRSFVYSFLCCFIFNIIGILIIECVNDYIKIGHSHFNPKEQEIKTIGYLTGLLCNIIIISLLLYHFK